MIVAMVKNIMHLTNLKKEEHKEKVNVDHPQGNSRIGLTYNYSTKLQN